MKSALGFSHLFRHALRPSSFVLLVLSSLAATQVALAQNAAVPGEVVVEFSREANPRSVRATRLSTPAVAGAYLREHLASDFRSARIVAAPSLPLSAVASVSPEQEAKDICATLKRDNPGAFRSCSPNYIVHTSLTPNDSRFRELWGMSSASGIDAPRAWDVTTGSNDEVVAVVDTGIAYNHPDLAANVWTNPAEIPGNGIDDDGNGYIDDVHGINAATGSGDPMDDNGHGTHVSGTIAAAGNNSLGVVGVNWQTKVVAAKFLNAGGSGNLADAIKAINYIVDLKQAGVNIRVMNNSWGGGGYSEPLYNAIARANDAGIIFAAAAGNESNDNDSNPAYPAGYDLPNVVSVAAVDQEGNVASFSNYGAATVDIAAPGVGILSTVPGGGYASYSGTSMATPHVVGALALLLGQEPSLSIAAALERLYASGRTLATLSGAVRTGRLLNVGGLITGDSNPLPQLPSGPECQYTIATVSTSPDTSADDAPVVIQADDNHYYTVALPFEVPWDGGPVSSITISPNGVVYMGKTPASNDYLPGASAPRNSIAALHADLYPVGKGYGVKVAVASDAVTVNWTATSYALKSGVAIVRLRIQSDGRIQSWYEFQDPVLEDALRSTATIGVRGASQSSIATYSAGDGKLRDGLALEFMPQCGDVQGANAQSIDLAGISRGKESSRVEAGKQLAVRVSGSGTGAVSLQFAIEKTICKELAVKVMNDGQLTLTTRVPNAVARSRYLQVSVVGTVVKGRISVSKPRSMRAASNRRLSRKEINSSCATLISSLR